MNVGMAKGPLTNAMDRKMSEMLIPKMIRRQGVFKPPDLGLATNSAIVDEAVSEIDDVATVKMMIVLHIGWNKSSMTEDILDIGQCFILNAG